MKKIDLSKSPLKGRFYRSAIVKMQTPKAPFRGLGVLLLFAITFSVQAQSPYIGKIFDYRPAPGQFVNMLPEYQTGDTRESMIRKVEEYIAGDEKIPVTLGGYGGYVVFGFDHPVVNIPGEYDFKIWGNAFSPDANAGADKKSGSSEPGIVLVSYDANGNGIPDDEWYELAGSEYNKPETIHDYRISYYKPDAGKTPTPDHEQTYLSDTTYIQWMDNRENQGYIFKNTFHKQAYYPEWVADTELIFEGGKLADNFLKNETGLYVQAAYDWGYADNHINDSEFSNFNLEWAVDKDGNKVHLPQVHFFKVYTAVNQYCGILGETSTEITGAEDLHPSVASIKQPQKESIKLLNNPVKNQLNIVSPVRQVVNIYNLYGAKALSFSVETGTNILNCHLPQGIYILKTSNTNLKFIKQ